MREPWTVYRFRWVAGKRSVIASVVLALAFAAPYIAHAACPEKPTVQMDEFTARSHLTAKRDVELPAALTRFTRPQVVMLLVTVDRRGSICDLQAVAGPAELRSEAMRVVKKHWRFRPFRVDWKPVVAQFPVSVRCVPPRRQRPRWIMAGAAPLPLPDGTHPRA